MSSIPSSQNSLSLFSVSPTKPKMSRLCSVGDYSANNLMKCLQLRSDGYDIAATTLVDSIIPLCRVVLIE